VKFSTSDVAERDIEHGYKREERGRKNLEGNYNDVFDCVLPKVTIPREKNKKIYNIGYEAMQYGS
jgi:hypothetical protein